VYFNDILKETLEGQSSKKSVIVVEPGVCTADQLCREQVDEYNVRFQYIYCSGTPHTHMHAFYSFFLGSLIVRQSDDNKRTYSHIFVFL